MQRTTIIRHSKKNIYMLNRGSKCREWQALARNSSTGRSKNLDLQMEPLVMSSGSICANLTSDPGLAVLQFQLPHDMPDTTCQAVEDILLQSELREWRMMMQKTIQNTGHKKQKISRLASDNERMVRLASFGS